MNATNPKAEAGGYDEAFYADRDRATRRAAQRLLGLVREAHAFDSVADIGCGVGTWLSTALDLGASRARGWEGEWVRPDMIADARVEVTACDLEQPLPGAEPVDLAISLEVAEHLSEARAESFVDELCAMAPVVMFSAANPGQTGGVGHINMQWQGWWVDKFRARDYQPLDLLRPVVWNDAEIPVWYRQNTLLYAGPGAPELQARARAQAATLIPDLVHPELLMRRMRPAPAPAAPGLRARLALAAGIPRLALRAALRRGGGGA